MSFAHHLLARIGILYYLVYSPLRERKARFQLYIHGEYVLQQVSVQRSRSMVVISASGFIGTMRMMSDILFQWRGLLLNPNVRKMRPLRDRQQKGWTSYNEAELSASDICLSIVKISALVAASRAS